MAEKDKVIAKLIERHTYALTAGGNIVPMFSAERLALEIWDAARAAAIEECAKIAENYKMVDLMATHGMMRERIAAAIRSLSREKEEPHPCNS